jgi:hypothetical protein
MVVTAMRWAVLALCACGRVGFDASRSGDATGDAIGGDARSDATTDPDLVLHVTFDQARPYDQLGHAASCSQCPTNGVARVGSDSGAFDGSQCIEFADATDLRPSSFTLAAFVKFVDLSIDMTIAGRAFNGMTMDANPFELYQTGANRDWCGAVNSQVSCFTMGEVNAWHHLALTYDAGAGRASFYVDGQFFEGVVWGPPMYASDSVLVGCDRNFGVNEGFFRGELDDVRLYQRALIADEVQALTTL